MFSKIFTIGKTIWDLQAAFFVHVFVSARVYACVPMGQPILHIYIYINFINSTYYINIYIWFFALKAKRGMTAEMEAGKPNTSRRMQASMRPVSRQAEGS